MTGWRTMETGNAAAPTGLFGRRPSFHDAEVVSVLLDRRGTEDPTLTARRHVFERMGETDDLGCYVTEKHVMATLRFSTSSFTISSSSTGRTKCSP